MLFFCTSRSSVIQMYFPHRCKIIISALETPSRWFSCHPIMLGIDRKLRDFATNNAQRSLRLNEFLRMIRLITRAVVTCISSNNIQKRFQFVNSEMRVVYSPQARTRGTREGRGDGDPWAEISAKIRDGEIKESAVRGESTVTRRRASRGASLVPDY